MNAEVTPFVENDFKFEVPQVETISVDTFGNVCRTCLGKDDIKSIFGISYEQCTLQEMLGSFASIQVHQDDCLPQNICSVCLNELIRSFSFWQKCQQSDTLLRNVYNSEAGEIKCQTENSLRLIRNHLETKCGERKNESDQSNENHNPNGISICKAEDHTEDVLEADIENSYSDVEGGTDSSDHSDVKPIRVTRIKVKMKRERQMLRKNQIIKLRGGPFKCRDCSKNFLSRDQLREHRKSAKHPEVRNHSCSFCDKKFTSSKLRQHMRVHTKEKPFVCKICLQAFSMSGNLKRHMMTHTGERPHVCEVCGKGFIQATTLEIHKRTHANNERRESGENDSNSGPNFVCDYCGRGFKRLARYNAHLKKHFNENKDSRKSVQEDDLKEYTCDTCKRAYKTKHLLKAHQLTHGEKTFLCSDCGKGFVTKAALQSHFKVHTGERPHMCTVCKKSFAHVGSFEAHVLIHTGQKPYNCNICTKAFTQLSHLKYHLRTHSGERPYVCSYCGKTFALKGNLTVHVRIHTGETPYLCPDCGKGFYDSSSMKRHRRGHTDLVISLPVVNDGNSVVQTEPIPVTISDN